MRGLRKVIYSWIDRTFLGGCSSYNSLDVRKSCRSKFQAREMFRRNDIPHARGTTFFNPFTAIRFAQQNGFPLVVKPNVSGFSRGSHFPIRNFKELYRAIFLARLWWPVSVVEQYLEGSNYRVLVVKGEIMSVIRRYPPFVDGDGVSRISELIDRENATRDEMGLLPVIHHIEKNKKVIAYLKEQGLSLDSVIETSRRVHLFNRIALAPGGVVEIVDVGKIPEVNQKMFLKVLEHFQANILGIDAIFEEGIEKDYRTQRSILLEVNSRPYMKMHHYPRYGTPQDLSRYYNLLDELHIEEQDVF